MIDNKVVITLMALAYLESFAINLTHLRYCRRRWSDDRQKDDKHNLIAIRGKGSQIAEFYQHKSNQRNSY